MINKQTTMKTIDNSNLCWECTGRGCKVCNGTGIDPEYKPSRTTQLILDKQQAELDLLEVNRVKQIKTDTHLFIFVGLVTIATLLML